MKGIVLNKMKNIKTFVEKNCTKIIFLIIIIIAILVRIYKLDQVPHGVNVDEAGMAYDAYCLSNYGTDRYLNHLPVYLINFGSGQSALYAYLASIFVKLFGFSIVAVRMPAVILGIIAIILSYYMVRDRLGEKFALTFMALISICPWHIMASRWGLDCNLLAPMSIISLFFLVKAKKWWGYLIAGISFGITLYTYALSYIIMPIFLGLTIGYMLYTKKISFKNLIILGIPIAILATPLVLMILVNNNVIPEIKGFITIPKLWFYRGAEISLSNIKDNVIFLKKMFENDVLVYNSLPEYGTLYLFAPFLAIFGFFVEINNLVKNIKEKKFEINSLMLFLCISTIICMLLIVQPNVNKANCVYIPLIFLTVIALRHIYRNFKVFFEVMIVLYVISFCSFVNFYFNIYPQKYEYQPFFESDLIDSIRFVDKDEELSKKEVYINTTSSQPYIYTLIENKISPYEFNEKINRTSRFLSYGKYHFEIDRVTNQNAVYIVQKSNEALVEELKIHGYKIHEIKSYILAY